MAGPRGRHGSAACKAGEGAPGLDEAGTRGCGGGCGARVCVCVGGDGLLRALYTSPHTPRFIAADHAGARGHGPGQRGGEGGAGGVAITRPAAGVSVRVYRSPDGQAMTLAGRSVWQVVYIFDSAVSEPLARPTLLEALCVCLCSAACNARLIVFITCKRCAGLCRVRCTVLTCYISCA